jgi:hypothetical protein
MAVVGNPKEMQLEYNIEQPPSNSPLDDTSLPEVAVHQVDKGVDIDEEMEECTFPKRVQIIREIQGEDVKSAGGGNPPPNPEVPLIINFEQLMELPCACQFFQLVL